MLNASSPTLPLAVVVHPHTVHDFARRFGWTRHIPPRLAEAVLPLVPPFALKTAAIAAGERETDVTFIACPATAAQINAGRVNLSTKLASCFRLAVERGAAIAVLTGYLNASCGRWRPDDTNFGVVPWSDGADGKLLLALWAMRAVASLMGVPLVTARVAVLAATEPAGAVMAHLLAREVGELTLIDRPGRRLERLAEEILAASGTAAVVIHRLTPTTGQLLVAGGRRAAELVAQAAETAPELLSRAVILDLGRPPFLTGPAYGAFVFHGGAARLPDPISLPEELGFPPRTACGAITEGLLLALAGERPRRSGGGPTLSGCDRLAELAKRLGIGFAALMRDNQVLPWGAVRAELARADGE